MTKEFKVLSIDAWRDGSSWFWNNWFHVESIPIKEYSTRQLLKLLREKGLLSESSKGKVSIEDDQYNFVIMAKGTRKPLFAVEYGSHY